MYKLIAIDMDGTLLNDHHEVTAEVREALDAAKAEGVNIVLCTGRPIGGVQRYLDELNLKEEGDYVIAYNGALVQNTYTNGVVAEQSLGFEDLQSLHELSLELDTPMHYFDAANLYTPNRDISEYTVYESFITKVPLHFRTIEEMPKDILIPKIMFINDPEKLDKAVESIPESYREKYTMVKSAPFFYEILHPKVSKGNAVKLLAEQLSIEQKHVMAIGDNGNDLSMIKWAGCGVAMANAIPEAREIADYETKSNNEHGVAHAIQELVLKK